MMQQTKVVQRKVEKEQPEMAASSFIEHDKDFFYTYQEEPHRTRRKQIIASHPEITKLNGYEPLTKWVVLGVCTVQFIMAYLVRDMSLTSWKFWLVAYFVGATCVSNLFLAIHELSHNLGFKKPLHNKLFSILTNLPIGVPYSASFAPYHLLHHKYMGDETYDTDIPTPLEAAVLSSVLGKAFFATFQLFFYALRPMFIINIKFTWVHLLNVVVQFTFDYFLIKSLGVNAFYYLLISDFLAGSLHPIAGHFIAEHYVFEPPTKYDPKGTPFPETYSYYGALNIFVYNAGYHSEHHDFPYIPWTRIKKVRQIAAEFYDPLPYHTSWVKVIYDFVFDQNVTLWCRVKRAEGARKREHKEGTME